MPSGDVIQSVLAPAGSQSSSIYQLWSLMLLVTTIVFVVSVAFVVAAFARGVRRRRDRSASTPERPAPSSERSLSRWVAGGVAITVVILVALLVASVWTGRTIASLHASSAVTIEVTGHQWWWEIVYDDAVPSRRVQTANEVHVPLDRPVVLKVTSRDVIHSFWAPNLHGKRDLIPGYTTAIWLQADRAGIFRGQCAEFCGLQHAHMAFDVVAEPEADFERWLDGMRQPARPPQSETERRGRDVFMTTRCAGCHTVQGTDAHGQVAPDLTHMGTRSTIGAGTLPNTREHMQAWIRDPQASKPGNQMPPNPLSADDLQALLAYLETLR
ncbi:MAG: cytochrome c oxidase, subunit [Acidobacteria bacterium]|nr:cytochrome c oxidase, subunit [Acidobacteriota bacterium]